MRFPFLLLVCGFLALTGPVAKAAPVRKIVPKGATNFISKEHQFKIWLPVKPEFIEEDSPGKSKEFTSFVWAAESKKVLYYVMIKPNLAGIAGSSSKKQLDEVEKQTIQGFKAKFKKSEAIQLDKFAGRQINLAGVKTHKGKVFARIYVTPKISYSVIAGAYVAEMQNQAAQINRVFDSFRILPG